MIHRCICVVIVWLEQSCWDVAAELVLVNLRTDLIEFAFTYASAHQHSARRSVQKQQHWVGRLMSLNNLWQGKVGSAFTSVGGHGRGFGGHEAILQSFHATFLQHGMVCIFSCCGAEHSADNCSAHNARVHIPCSTTMRAGHSTSETMQPHHACFSIVVLAA